MARHETPEPEAAAEGEFAKGWTFEKALERLEKIVAEMEAGKLPLEAMIGRFEEGQKLIQFCTRKLNEVERRIELLVKKGEAVAPEPFDLRSAADDSGEPHDEPAE